MASISTDTKQAAGFEADRLADGQSDLAFHLDADGALSLEAVNEIAPEASALSSIGR